MCFHSACCACRAHAGCPVASRQPLSIPAYGHPFALRRCFQGKHVVFMGDSLTRYQYMNLAYLLSKLHRAEPYGGVKGLPSLSMETEWKDWHQFYHFSSAILGAAADGCATETCDCQRDREDALLELTREYRTLHLSFPHKCQAKHHPGIPTESIKHLTVSYHQVFGRPDPTTAGMEGMRYYTDSFGQQPPDILSVQHGSPCCPPTKRRSV